MSMTSPPLLVSVCSPCHNEAENLSALVSGVAEAMRPLFGDRWEHLLVDDASTDGSAVCLRALQARHPQLRTCLHSRNLGQRAGFQTAFEQARGEIVVMMDADLQEDPADIPRLIEPVSDGGCDCCTGARAARRDGTYFSAATWGLSKLMALAFELHVRDPSSSFFAVRSSLLPGLCLIENDHRYILAILQRRGARLLEREVRHRARQHGQTHYSRWKVPRAIPELARFASRYYSGFYDR